MKCKRKKLLDSHEAILSFMSKDMPFALAMKASIAYDKIFREVNLMKIHNLSQLKKYGTRDEEKQIYVMNENNSEYNVYMSERDAFLNDSIDVAIEPFTAEELVANSVLLKPLEIRPLLELGIIILNQNEVN